MSIIGNVCEDLLLFDGRRSSARQWNDIFRIIKQQGAALDVSYLAQWVDVLGVRDLLECALVEVGFNQP